MRKTAKVQPGPTQSDTKSVDIVHTSETLIANSRGGEQAGVERILDCVLRTRQTPTSFAAGGGISC
jgi:hypothetical protein